MKLLAPVNSIESAEWQIQNGADELYVGVTTDWGRNVSFSARGNFRRDGHRVVLTFEELRELSKLCKKTGKGLDIAVNSLHPTGFLNLNRIGELSYLYFIDELLKLDITSLIIADISAIKLVHKKYPTVHITSSNVLEPNNSQTIVFLKELGVSRVVLPYQITLDEIVHIRNQTDIEIEIFAHYGCSFHDGFCMFKHNVGEAGRDGINVATPCKNIYTILNDESGIKPKAYLDASLVCSICAIPELLKTGVDVVKIVGRELPGISNVEITRVYRRAIDLVSQGETNTEILKKELPIWWSRTLCKQNRCKYKNNPISRSFTGRLEICSDKKRKAANNLKKSERINISKEINEVWLLNTETLDFDNVQKHIRFIGIGHEYCSIFLRNQDRLFETVEQINERQKIPVLITPCVRAKEFELIQQIVLDTLRKYPHMEIVFNDYGLLRIISQFFKNRKRSYWWVGRLISRTMSDWPWFDVIMRSEKREVYNSFLHSSTNHKEIAAILKRFGIDGIELNNSKLNEENCRLVKSFGFRSKVHLGPELLAVSRSCIQLSDKLTDKQEIACNGRCSKIGLKLHSLESSDVSSNSGELLNKYYPELIVAGAGVFNREFDSKLNISNKYVDRICIEI